MLYKYEHFFFLENWQFNHNLGLQPSPINIPCLKDYPHNLKRGTFMNWEKLGSTGSSCPEVFCKEGVLRNFTKFTGKHLCQSLFFNKVEISRNTFFHRTLLVAASEVQPKLILKKPISIFFMNCEKQNSS